MSFFSFLFRFWYVDSWSKALAYYQKTVGNFEDQIAIKATWRNIGKPLFQDYTLQGKIIGFFFRILRIFFGLIVYGILAFLTSFIFVFWLLLPIFCIVSILGYFIAPKFAQNQTVSTSATNYFQQ